MSDAPRIGVEDVSLSRRARSGDLPVLSRMTLAVGPGEIAALVGPSGCGKSTLLGVVAGLEEPTRGRVTVDGEPDPARLGRLALMPQRDALMPWRTAIDNVACSAQWAGATGSETLERASAALERAGLAGFEEHYPHALSGGMRQRVALARTLASESRGWLLDEPFGALDAMTRSTLHRELERAWRDSHATVLLVTHDLDEALILADRVFVCGPRPASVVAEIDVPLRRPRTLADTTRPEFASLKASLLDALGTAGAIA